MNKSQEIERNQKKSQEKWVNSRTIEAKETLIRSELTTRTIKRRIERSPHSQWTIEEKNGFERSREGFERNDERTRKGFAGSCNNPKLTSWFNKINLN